MRRLAPLLLLLTLAACDAGPGAEPDDRAAAAFGSMSPGLYPTDAPTQLMLGEPLRLLRAYIPVNRAHTLKVLPNGDLLFAGMPTNPLIVHRYAPDGTERWQKDVGLLCTGQDCDAKVTSEGILVIGVNASGQRGGVEVGPSGEVVAVYDTLPRYDQFERLAEPGRLVMQEDEQTVTVYERGIRLWSYISAITLVQIKPLADGGLLLLGSQPIPMQVPSRTQAHAIRLNASGETVWTESQRGCAPCEYREAWAFGDEQFLLLGTGKQGEALLTYVSPGKRWTWRDSEDVLDRVINHVFNGVRWVTVDAAGLDVVVQQDYVDLKTYRFNLSGTLTGTHLWPVPLHSDCIYGQEGALLPSGRFALIGRCEDVTGYSSAIADIGVYQLRLLLFE